jgi:hypothetical protein
VHPYRLRRWSTLALDMSLSMHLHMEPIVYSFIAQRGPIGRKAFIVLQRSALNASL